MKKKQLLILAIAMALTSNVLTADTFDMGKVQVVGKDAQEEKINQVKNELNLNMGEKFNPMPEIIPDSTQDAIKPLTEKKIIQNIHKENKEEISISLGLGNNSANEIIIDGKGEKNGYTGDIKISRQAKDGYKSSVDDKQSFISGTVSSVGEGSYNLSVSGEYGSETFGQRGTNALPTPNVEIEDSGLRLGINGHSTLEDGAFFTGFAKIDSLSREINNSQVNFKEEDTVFSFNSGASYLKSLTPKFKGKAAIQIKSDKYTSTGNPDRDCTKTVLKLGGDYDLSTKAMANFGFKSISLMSKDRIAPFLKLDYRWAKPWQAILSYNEDLGNDSLEEIFMPARYVSDNPIAASHKKRLQGTVNYKTRKGHTLGIDIFSEKEEDAIEYLDFYDPGKAMLTSNFRFVNDAKRKGTTLRGAFKIEDNFKLKIKTTYQTPEDTASGRRLSYEPKRILDVGFNYTEGKFMMDFSRRAEFDRTAYSTTTSVGAEDYSRSDLVVRYKINKTYNAYLKIKDLYDEAKQLRYDVPEEGRLSVAGIEAHF
eukprot:Anaeramoba_ignava/c20692_g1_i2.p1 GENE.c20692_g1_i2~~c20692_g1_i2.p1  ORF type:complete len:538 (-),score=64.95 c20692_g1_i2:2257-3870(-)